MVDYDSLLSYLTLKYGSPGERESCLRLTNLKYLFYFAINPIF